MTFWFNKKINGIKRYCSKSISINFYKKHYKKTSITTNGAIKGNIQDTCLDVNIWFLGLNINYTNWDYNSNIKIENIKTIRLKKLKHLNKNKIFRLLKT